jgi:hypothetical protein
MLSALAVLSTVDLSPRKPVIRLHIQQLAPLGGDFRQGDENGYQKGVKTIEGVEEVYEDLGHQDSDSVPRQRGLSFWLTGGTADLFSIGRSRLY